MSFSPLPRLRTAAESRDRIEYKTGAKYEGQVDGKKRKGSGTFYWPNGAKYEGEFSDNQRQGQGIQVWADGSTYEGVFKDDLRHGQGTQTWTDGSKYTGTFFRDRRHGNGSYLWSDGSNFTGFFYVDRREGYGKLTLCNGNVFEGLYRKDERFGPGILTYSDGKQDVGLWCGEKLVKVLSPVDNSFSMTHHTKLDYCRGDHVTMLTLDDRYHNNTHVISPIIHPPTGYKYSGNSNLEENSKSVFNDSLHPDSLAMNCEVFESEFFKDSTDADKNEVKVTQAINSSPVLIDMQKYIHRHRHTAKSVPFNATLFQHGPRTAFKAPPGPLENKSIELIEACFHGDREKVQNLLIADDLSPDVADSTGFTALQAAVMNCHQPIINMLLDAGADVNKLSDEGLSALAQCFVFYYPVESFKENIAEKEYLIPKTNGSAMVLNGSTNKLSSKEQLSSRSSEDRTNNKAITPNARDSGFESRKDVQNLPPPSEVESSAVTPATQVSRELVMSRSSSHNQTSAAGSERDQSPSAFSRVTDDVIATVPGEGSEIAVDLNDVLSTDDEDEISLVSSQAVSHISTKGENFFSDATIVNYGIKVKDELIERCATALSHNEMVTKRENGSAKSFERTRALAQNIAMKKERWETIQLLLKRGANPNVCSVPMPALVFTIKAGDMEATKLLLLKGANANLRLPEKKGGLSPLHLAAGTPGAEGILITEYLLDALSDPDARATADNSYLDPDDELGKEDGTDEWSDEEPSAGRTPLHIACSRDDDYTSAASVVHLLLDHKADADVLCNGHSPLSLAIVSGNDLAIAELLKFKANPSLRLTHGNGNALCVASHTAYEHRRSADARISLIDKLVENGADILALIPIGPKQVQGTALDYAYHIFNLDRRIAHMPYHALSYSERETYNARRRLLGHMGDVVRLKCVEREQKRLEDEIAAGIPSRSPSARFLFTGSGAKVPSKDQVDGREAGEGKVKFNISEKGGDGSNVAPNVRRPLFKYCYDCGRSINVRLTACTRCKEVYFCSKTCKVKAWNARHKDECIRMQGSKNPSRTTSHAKSAPAKYGGRGGAYYGNINPKRAAKMEKSYNMMRRPTDKTLGSKQYWNSQPNLAGGKNRQFHKHNQHGGGRMSPDLMPFVAFMDNYSFV